MTFTVKSVGLRHDTKDLFRICNSFTTNAELKHFPFLVIAGDTIIRVEHRDELLTYPNETQVLVQWEGQWRSDFFLFTVGEYRAYLESRA